MASGNKGLSPLRADRRAALGMLAAGGALASLSRPVLAAGGGSGSDAVAADILRSLLERNLLPFWRRVADLPSVEGYHLNIDNLGQWLEPTNRPIIPQARTTWFFARLARSRWSQPGDLALAKRGFDFLTQRMWHHAPGHGGFVWEVAAKDTYLPTRPDKYLNAQAHALLALSEYAIASGSAEALDWARQAASTIEYRLRNPDDTSDYVDFLRADWSQPPPDLPGYTGLLPSVRAYNARFRLLDALTAYYVLERTPAARTQLTGAISLAERALATTPAHYFRATNPAPSTPRVSYATDLQTIHQLRRARAELGLPEPESYRAVLDSVLRWGEDRRSGGIYEEGAPGQPADRLSKFAWMQSEALLGTCDSWVRTGNVTHRAAFWRTLLWIARRQADWAHGEWHNVLIDGVPSGIKEAPFHTVRAVLYALELLQGRSGGR
jgi:cellobiose epimerase